MAHPAEMPAGNYEDYHQGDPRIAEYLLVKYPDTEISETGIRIMSVQLARLRDRHGDPSSPLYLSYHNDIHAMDDVDRGFTTLSIFSKIPGMTIKDIDYELLALGLMFHDDEHKGRDGKSAERICAENLELAMRSAGYPDDQIHRAVNVVIATEVIIGEKGVRQLNVVELASDPVVVAAALADIAAIIYEGGQRMIQDVTNLAAEMSDGGKIKVDVLKNLLDQQYAFITDRISDMNSYIEKLCEGPLKPKASDVKDALQKYFQTDLQEATMLATKINEYPGEFHSAVEQALEKPAENLRQSKENIRIGIIKAWRWVSAQSPLS